MSTDQTAPSLPSLVHAQRVAFAKKAEQSLFLAFVVLVLIAPSLTNGPLTWLPVVQVDGIDEAPVRLGPLAAVPPLALITWVLVRIGERPPRPWRWGRLGLTLPLIGLSLLMLFGLEPTANRRTLIVILTLGLLWWVYLFVVNEVPHLTFSLALVILIQSGVAIGQFALQRDLGLDPLGEPTLNANLSGTCVLFARQQRWLRAYGLSGHPNVLGAMLSIMLLFILDDMAQARHWRKAWFTLVASTGLLGLLTTFSRSAWLAFGVGFLGWLTRNIVLNHQRHPDGQRPSFYHVVRALRRHLQFIIPAILALVFLLFFHDLVASRFLHLQTPIEARSIQDRRTDAELALLLVKRHPWFGVGVRNYLPAVRAIEPDSRTVHNVPLLTAAELGLPGASLWLWIALSGLVRPRSAAWPPWVAMLITHLFDIALFPTNGWHAALAFGLLAGQASVPRRTADDLPVPNQARPSEGQRSSRQGR